MMLTTGLCIFVCRFTGYTCQAIFRKVTSSQPVLCVLENRISVQKQEKLKRGAKQDGAFAQSDVSSCGHAPMRARVGWF